MATEITTEGLVLRRFDTGEADRVVWLLTPQHGRLSAFAPAARKSRRRFAGSLEPFTRLTAQLRPPGRGELWRLVETRVLDSHAAVRDSLEGMAEASVACELTWAMATESTEEGAPAQRSPQGDHYGLLLAYLRRLSRDPAPSDDLYRFVLLALEAAGVRPRFAACARCGRTDLAGLRDALYFDPSEGGRLCATCRPRTPSGRSVPPGLLESLRAFEEGQGGFPAAGRDLLWGYAQHHAGHPLKSLGLLAELGL